MDLTITIQGRAAKSSPDRKVIISKTTLDIYVIFFGNTYQLFCLVVSTLSVTMKAMWDGLSTTEYNEEE